MRYKGLHPNSINEVSQSVVGIYAGGEQIALFSTGSTVFNTSVTGSTFSGSFYGDGSNLSGVSTFPYTGTAVITGSLVVTNHVSASLFSGSFYGDGSNLTGLTQGNRIFTQTVAASTWSFVHGSGASYPVVTIYNDSDEVVVPTRILNVDNDTLQVEFGSPVAGYAVISFGDRISGSTVKQDFTTPAVSWSFEHNLNSQYVHVQIFDSNDQQIIPASLTLLNVSSSLITFASASTGYALATIGGEPITGLFAQASSSFASRITDLESFSSSLDATFATDAELAAVSSSIVSDVSSSYLLKTTDTFNGTLTVTGSLEVTGSTTITGSLSVNNYTFPLTDGTVKQIMFTDGAGNITFDFLRDVYVEVKNVSLSTLPKGTPVHVTGSTGNTNLVIPASASDATTMPATFVLNEQLDPDQEGLGIAVGFINGVDTSGFEEGQIVYVGENGGYTNIQPTGSNLIQNLGIVTKVDASNGSGYVLGAGRTNAVPNLLNGEVFFGEGNTAVQKSLATILSSSFYNYSGSFTGSLLGTSSTASYVSFAGVDGLTSFSSSVSTRVTDLETASGSFSTRVTDLETASGSFSTRVTANEAGIASLTAATSSYLLNTTDTLTGDLTVTGKITAQEFHTEFVSASIIYQSGSTKFGDTFDDIHSFTGSVSITGSGTFSNYGPAYFMQGNVGIGTTSPNSKLELVESGATQVYTQFTNNAGSKFSYIGLNPSGTLSITTNDEITFNYGLYAFTGMRLNSSGNLIVNNSVGIGTTSLSQKLHVAGNIRIDGVGNNLSFDTTGAAGTNGIKTINDYETVIYNGRGSSGFAVIGNSDIRLGFGTSYTAAQTDLYISNSGNVGIGTTSPSTKLTVVENGFGIRVQQSTDSTQYNLISGNQLQAYQSGTGGTLYLNYSNGGNIVTGNGNVGVGVSPSASYKLDVSGASIRATSNLILGEEAFSSSGDYVGLKTTFQTGTDDYMILSGKADGNTYVSAKDNNSVHIRGGGNDGGNQIIVYDSAVTDRIDFDTTTAYFNGNVGIGTTSPASKLDVAGGISWRLNSSETTYGLLGSGTAGVGIDTYNADSGFGLGIAFDGVEAHRFTKEGNVGIGTTSPDSKLTIRGANALVDVQSTADSQTIGFLARYQNSSTLGAGFKYTTVDAQLYIDNYYVGNPSLNYSDINIRNNDTSGNLQTRIKIKGGTGNVGIGTTGPQELLHVKAPTGSNDAKLIIQAGGEANESHLVLGTGYAGNDYRKTAIVADGITSYSRADLKFVLRNTADTTSYDVASDTKMTIRYNGNVGIGSTSPQYELDVNGVIRATTAIRGADGVWMLDGDSTQVTLGSSASSTDLRFDAGAANRMFINGDTGNVGIGTTSPAALLNVGGTGTLHYTETGIGSMLLKGSSGTARGMLEVHNGDSSSKLVLQAYSTGTSVGSLSATDFHLVSNGSNRITIKSGGSIGVNTTDPYRTFHVDGASAILRVGPYYTTGGDRDFIDLIASGTDTKIVSNNERFHIENNSGNILIMPSGNVGIGTTSPTKTLDVNGAIRTRNSFNISDGTTQIGGLFPYKLITGGGTDNSTALFAETGLDLHFMTNGSVSSKMIITSGGYVGIGTTSPSANLDVVGGGGNTSPTLELNSSTSTTFNHAINAFNSNLTSGENQVIVVGKEGSTKNSGYIGYTWNGAGSNSNLVTFGHWASDNLMNLTGDGKLGIGTTTPSHALSVTAESTGNATAAGVHMGAEGSGTYGRIEIVGSTGSYIDFTAPNVDRDGRIIYNNANDTMDFQVAGVSTNRLRVSTSGIAVIGTKSFRMIHPDPAKSSTMELWHSAVESPTSGDNIYRWQVEVKDGIATILLPAYYKHLNENHQVWVSPVEHFGQAYGKVTENEEYLVINANADGLYNVLLIGTRKDADAKNSWTGAERPRTLD